MFIAIKNSDGETAYARFDDEELYNIFLEGANLQRDLISSVRKSSSAPDDYLIVDEEYLISSGDDIMDFVEEIYKGLEFLFT